MLRQLSTILIVSGLMLALLASLLLVAPLAAQGGDDLPPRPTLTPQPVVPTPPPPPPPPASDPAPPPSATPLPSGRITGTVIDLTTGAPVAGVTVQVGTWLVSSDAAGNYNVEPLPAGIYTVELLPTTEQGVAAQGTLTLELLPGATIVQHLHLRSALPLLPSEPTPTPAPELPPVQPTEPVVPIGLPVTAGTTGWSGGLLLLGLSLVAAGLGLRRR